MSLYVKIILIIFGLAYLISPVDIIPDIVLPYIGWLDDGVVLATIFYLIRYGRLPDFIFKNKGLFNRPQYSKTRQEKQEFQNNANTNHANSGRYNRTAKKETPIPKTPWEILGVSETASKKEIQAAYKQAIKKYHPDKLSHLGEEFSTLANEKFLEIQKAYDQLMQRY